MPATSENPLIVPALHLSRTSLSRTSLPRIGLPRIGLPRIVSTGLLFAAGVLSLPVEAVTAFGMPVLLAQRAGDSLDPDAEVRGVEWDHDVTTPLILDGGGAGHIVNGGIPAGRPGLPPVNDASPVLPGALPAVPASLPKRPGAEPLGDGGAMVRTAPAVAPAVGAGGDLRLLMREYGARFGESRGDAGAVAPGVLREAGGDVRWLDADERTVFREALRERHRRARH